MPVSTTYHTSNVNSCINSNPNELVTAQLSGIACTNTIQSVADSDQLPTASNNQGRMIYLEDNGSYRYSDGISWTSCFDTTCTITANRIVGAGLNQYQIIDPNLIVNFDISSPTEEFTSGTDWCYVKVGFYSALAIKNNGTLYGWGNSQYYTTFTACGGCLPSAVQAACGFTDWVKASNAWLSGAGLRSNGEIWSSGYQPYGEVWLPIAGFNTNPQQESSSATDWCDMTTGYHSTLAIKTNGTLWTGGGGISLCCGTLGINDTSTAYSSPVQEITSATDWSKVYTSYTSAYAIKTSGQLWVWGDNRCGQLATNDTINYSSPVQEVTSATDWCVVSASNDVPACHVIAVKSNGTLWGWGLNLRANLGVGDAINYSSPVQEITSATDWATNEQSISVDVCTSWGIKTNGDLYAWGHGICGKMFSGFSGCVLSPTILPCGYQWCAVDGGANMFLGIRQDVRGFNQP